MKIFLLVPLLATISFFAQSQTKGTNTVELGMNLGTRKTYIPPYSSERSNADFSLGYGYFLKDNQKAGLTLFFGKNKRKDSLSYPSGNSADPSVSYSYGGSLGYQKYFALFKNFYGFGGGRAAYRYNEEGYRVNDAPVNIYSAGLQGGLSWFLFKHLALEADLLSADVVQTKYALQSGYKNSSTKVDVNTSGDVNGLAFKIYLIF